jgi:hypothetical protein
VIPNFSTEPDAKSRYRLATGVLSLVATIVVTLLLVIETSSENSDSLAAIFPPWWGSARAFEAAASVGDIAGVGKFQTILIVHGNSKRLAAGLHAAGAVVVVGAPLFVACIQPNGKLR